MTDSEQPRLALASPDDLRADTLIITASNAAAWAVLERWKAWPAGALALAGPEGAGKTHMARAWGERVGAPVWDGRSRALDLFEAGGRKLVIDNADRFSDEAHLALVLDAARLEGGAVLLAAREPPGIWPVRLADLRSRLAAAPVEVLREPDEALLAAVLVRLCKARFIKLTDKAARYLTAHMERSFAAAHRATVALERAHLQANRPVTVQVAVRALRSMGHAAPDMDEPPENA